MTGNKQAIINLSHPVGTYIETTTNTNPSNTLGGTWTLIDKQLRGQYLDSGIFTINTEVCSTSTQAVSIYGHTLYFRISVKYTGEDLTDGDTTIGSINFPAVGVSRFPNSRYYNNGYNESTNASIAYSVGYEDGEIRYRYGGLTKDSTAYFDFSVVITNIDQMLDSFCNRFTWRRTA